MTTDRRTQCTLLRQLLSTGAGPYTRHHAAATRECMVDMVKSGYLLPLNRKTAAGDELYDLNPFNDYTAKLLRDSQADQDRYQARLSEVVP